VRKLVLIAIFALVGCGRQSGDEAGPATTGTSAQAVLARAEASAQAGRQQRAKAIADGTLAAQAVAASRGITPPDGLVPGTLGDADDDGYAELEWTRMMPKEDYDQLQHAPPVVHIGNKQGKQIGTLHTIPALAGRKVRLSGYVVPLASDDQNRMTEFFFVPFYGACIHVPPPPPNMMVHVVLAHGIDPPQLWDPYWLRGVLRIETTSNSMAASAYDMQQAALLPYNEDHAKDLRHAFE
jgi:hypothetical protein